MILASVAKNSFLSIGVACVAQFAQGFLGSAYMDTFIKNSLINLLVALLAVNSATMGIVLTKIRDLIDRKGNGSGAFENTKRQMLLAVREQIALIIVGLLVLVLADSKYVLAGSSVHTFLQTVLCGVFVYAIIVLYDTAKSVIIIIDYDATPPGGIEG